MEWELTVRAGDGMGRREQRGKNQDNCNRITIKKEKKRIRFYLGLCLSYMKY